MSPARRRWVVVVTAVVGLSVAAVVTLLLRLPFTSDRLRARIVSTLEERLNSDVQLEGIALQIFPRLRAEGTGLVVRHKGRTDVPPFITVGKFTVEADLVGIWRRHVAHVQLEGLNIQIPPHDDDSGGAKAEKVAAGHEPAENTNARLITPGPPDESGQSQSLARQIVVDRLEAPQAEFTILRREAGKIPRTWYLHELRMRSVSMNSAMPFEALVTNAVPPGQIKTNGKFGPWNRDDLGITPIDGNFTFENANLGVFNGISGILSAHGSYQGSLARIGVDGETDTPDFMVTVSGHQLPLKTKYHALVDGTNGNTTLDPVNATFLNTTVVAKGGVYELENHNGREVRLDVTMEDGKLEDVMRMAVKSPKPPMTGTLHLTTKLIIPPGKIDVVEKLQLDGRFAIRTGRFTDPDVQAKINELSGRARGKQSLPPKPPGKDEKPAAVNSAANNAAKVSSDFTGRFRLAKGTLNLPLITFDVPGAMVEMRGKYALRPETIDFAGNLFMDAKISDTVSGWKSFVAKLADPFFRKNGKTVIPLKVGGTRKAPQFGLDVKKALTRDTPEAPATRKSK